MILLIFFLLALAVWAAFAAGVAGLAVAFAADPSFWPAFWLALVVLIGLSSAAATRTQIRSRSRK